MAEHDFKLSRNKQPLLDILGKDWMIKESDLERFIYRDLGSYDIEISGGNRRGDPVHIYVWAKKPVFHIVERHTNLRRQLSDIKIICDGIVARYSQDVKINA